MANDGGRYSITSYLENGKIIHKYSPNGHIKDRIGFPDFIMNMVERREEPNHLLDIKNYHEKFLIKNPSSKTIETKVKFETPKNPLKKE